MYQNTEGLHHQARTAHKLRKACEMHVEAVYCVGICIMMEVPYGIEGFHETVSDNGYKVNRVTRNTGSDGFIIEVYPDR